MLALATCSAAGVAPAASQSQLPALTGRVVDNANLLSPADEKLLSERSARLERATGHQLVVVTTSSLGGRKIEEYGFALGRSWKIGRKGHNDGVLLVVAPNERKVRIEVGYGLENALRDDEAAAIIRDAILPAFRKGDMPGGIKRGVERIVREIGPERAK